MGNFVLVYQSGTVAETEEAQSAAMATWAAGFGTLGAAVVDGGAPFGAAVGGGDAKTGLTGYSALEADGDTVDVYEAIDVTG